MFLGKRPRLPMRRSSSSAEFAAGVLFDVEEAPQPFDHDAFGRLLRPRELRWEASAAGRAEWRATRYVGSMLSPRGLVHRGDSGDPAAAAGMAPFLRACGLCNRRLGPGRDTYMYRGDVAFCSLECRQYQMNLDERKEMHFLASTKENTLPATNGSEQSDSGGPIIAA